MLLELNQLIVKAGHQLLIKDVSWPAYKRILAELGDNRSSPIYQVIPEYLMLIKTNGRNATMKAFRAWIRQQISSQI